MSSTYSPAPSDCGSVGITGSSCDCSLQDQHANGECLKTIAPLTLQSPPTRRRPEEAILMDDLRRAREEIQGLREELQKMRDERDKWKNLKHSMPMECYQIIKQHGLEHGLSLTTLQYLDAPAAVKRLEVHGEHMQNLFAKDSCDLAATVQNIILEIQFVKTTMGGDTLHWRLYSALNLMQHISRGLRRDLSCKTGDASTGSNRPGMMCDDYLRSILKSADVQLLSILNEVRERGLNNYYPAFRERFAPEYDLVHKQCALEFYEKTKALMTRMSSRHRTTVQPQTRVDEVVSRDRGGVDREAILATNWI